ncbi:hypothetical protein R80B4_00949 [Fibrobacteres bacterium R8-0-B4]
METEFSRFGAFLKQMRINMGFTLRRFCVGFGYDHQTQSKLERGLASPPATAKGLSKLAKDLCLWDGSNEWNQLFCLAKECAGKLPPAGLTEDELAKQLPLVFRTVGGKRLSEDKLLEFAQNFRNV